MMVLAFLGLMAWVGSVCLMLMGTRLIVSHFRKARRTTLPVRQEFYPPVTILKPLKGLDSQLESNIESFFFLDYPEYEILFSVADENDPAIPLIMKIISRFPQRPARLFVGEHILGLNPKVNNLSKSYDLAAHDWVLISDSNTRAHRLDLKHMAIEMKDDVGVVTSVVRGDRYPETLGGQLERIFLNTFYARWMLLSHPMGQPVVIGKSMLFRKSQARRFGGIQALAHFLAEDHMTGEAMRHLGLKVAVSRKAVEQPLGHYHLKDFWQRHLRWGRIRKSQVFVGFLLEPFLITIPAGVILAASLGHFLHLSASIQVMIFFAHLFFACAADVIVAWSIGDRISLVWPFVWLLREVLALPMWLHIAVGSTVNWRGHRLRLKSGGVLCNDV